MKNLTKTTLGIIAIVFISSFFIQCSDAKKKYLELQVGIVNKQCPLDMGNGMTMEKCTIEGGDTMVTEFSVADPSVLVINDETKATMINAFKNSPELKSAKDFGITYKYIYLDSDKKSLGEIVIAPDDYK